MSEILARLTRTERLESLHRGHISVSDANGNLLASLGDPNLHTYIRSAAKPFQIIPLLESGAHQHYGFSDKEITVMMASHNGEPFHVEAVKGLLAKIGLTADHLRCGFHLPLLQAAAAVHIKENAPKSPIYNNCSGKHTGMLALAHFSNWPLETYLEPEHPVQKRIKHTVALFAGLEIEEVGVGMDGCSAPVFYMPLGSMALMYAKLARRDQQITKTVFDLMSNNPEMIAGSDRFDTEIMHVTEGKVVSKVGAEGIRCLGIAGKVPFGVALKIEDGNKRASQTIVLEILRQMNAITKEELAALAKFDNPILRNHAGFEIGRLAVDFNLKRAGIVGGG